MSSPGVAHRENNGVVPPMASNGTDGHGRSVEIWLTAADNCLLAERAEAKGQSIEGYIRDQALGDRILRPSGRSSEVAVLEAQVQELRAKSAQLAVRNAEIEHRLNATTTELEALRRANNAESAERQERIKTLTEHLDLADRHVASTRSRLDQLTAESSRRIANLEGRLRERETEFVAETKRLKDALSTETGKLQKRIAELEDANQRLAEEARLATSAAARQRHALEGRVSSLLNDIELLKTTDAEAIADRDRLITSLRQELEKTKSVAATETAALRQKIADVEAAHQRDLQQNAKLIDGLKATVSALERDLQLAQDAAAAERQRLEAALADERDRARHQINARDEQRRKIEARAEAAEKQAVGATKKVTMEIDRANQLEIRLNAERTARNDEIEALTERMDALAAEREAYQNSANLIIDELRLRLAEAIGDDGATNAVATARDRRDALLDELQTLRAKVAEIEAAPAASSRAENAEEGAENAADPHIAEVLAYARTLEEQIAELRSRLDQPAEPIVAETRHHDDGALSSLRRLLGAKAAITRTPLTNKAWANGSRSRSADAAGSPQQASIRDVAAELKRGWDTVKALEMQYMSAQTERAAAVLHGLQAGAKPIAREQTAAPALERRS
jgi:DNA repair exonuclease SbcCD ATPase subunit